MLKPFLNVTGKVIKKLDDLGTISRAINELAKKDVLVGVPQAKSSRPGEPINNAELGFVLSEGVRPEHAREEIKDGMNQGQTYDQALGAYIWAHGDPLWHIPPRPFLGPSIELNAEKISKQQGKVIKAALAGNDTQVEAECIKLGLLAQNCVKAYFLDPTNGWDPNAPTTIEAKGSAKPLIDTGALRNSITYVIRVKV